MGRFLRLFSCVNRMACGSRNPAFLQNLVEQLPVLRRIHILRRRTENRNAHLHQAFRQLDGRLAAELNHRAIRLLNVHNTLHVFRSQWFKIQLIRNIEVGAYRLRIIIYDNGLIAFSAERPGAVNRAEVKFDSLADTNRAGTEDKHLFAVIRERSLILASKAGIVVRRLRGKLRRTRIHHLKCGYDSVVLTHLVNVLFRNSCQPRDDIVRELNSLGFSQQVHGERSLL